MAEPDREILRFMKRLRKLCRAFGVVSIESEQDSIQITLANGEEAIDVSYRPSVGLRWTEDLGDDDWVGFALPTVPGSKVQELRRPGGSADLMTVATGPNAGRLVYSGRTGTFWVNADTGPANDRISREVAWTQAVNIARLEDWRLLVGATGHQQFDCAIRDWLLSKPPQPWM